MSDYTAFTSKLPAKLPKSKKVFDNSKVTDHHAIIPTNVRANNLSELERRVYDLVARRFIAVFYPDCQIATTTVLGEVNKVEFKTTGKTIIDPGWRVVFIKEKNDEAEDDEEKVLPDFIKGESGPHQPALSEKWTQPPKPYTEATLLRAMETAGKSVDDEELRDALKENGIGRPSTRAAIIETLFKRKYIRKERKNLIATPTGLELIDTIHDELLKSAELTGIWENKLRKIEKGEYQAAEFIAELKEMVQGVVNNVKNDRFGKNISVTEDIKTAIEKKAKEKKKSSPAKKKDTQNSLKKDLEEKAKQKKNSEKETIPEICPKCGKGKVLKGKTAYGCSEWKNGCDFRIPFAEENK